MKIAVLFLLIVACLQRWRIIKLERRITNLGDRP